MRPDRSPSRAPVNVPSPRAKWCRSDVHRYGTHVAFATKAPGWVQSLVVAAANKLPSNAEYLAHLDVAAADPTLIRLASNENTELPSPRVREALERAYYNANLSPATVPPLRVALAERYGVGPEGVLLGAGSTELIEATMRTFLRAGDEVIRPSIGFSFLVARSALRRCMPDLLPLRTKSTTDTR